MTEPERPADAPSSPTPEEISARLEALLKRTHALRAKQAANPPSPLTITWPPHDGELDHYDVVDVPEDDRMQPAARATAATPPPSATLGGVSIESTPSGLPVTMEGRERGVTPITIGRLKPGRHDVLVGGLARKVDVTAGSVTTLRVISP